MYKKGLCFFHKKKLVKSDCQNHSKSRILPKIVQKTRKSHKSLKKSFLHKKLFYVKMHSKSSSFT